MTDFIFLVMDNLFSLGSWDAVSKIYDDFISECDDYDVQTNFDLLVMLNMVRLNGDEERIPRIYNYREALCDEIERLCEDKTRSDRLLRGLKNED